MPPNGLIPSSDGQREEAVLQALGLNPRDPRVQALALVAQRYNLDLILKHVFLIQGTVYVSHAGLLHLAHGSGDLDGIEVEVVEDDRKWTATAKVYRKSMSRPFTYMDQCLKNEKVQDPRKRAITRAERNALRRAFDVAVDVWEEDRPSPPVTLSPTRPEIPRRSTGVGAVSAEGGPSGPGLESPRVSSGTGPEPPSAGPTLDHRRSVVVRCREAGLDDDERHAMVRWVTKGRSESTKDLEASESAEAHRALAYFDKTGEKPWRTSAAEKSASVSPASSESPAKTSTSSSEQPPGDNAASAGQ